MKIARILIKNFLSIGEVEILPGQVNQIVGANRQGKTSILKALEFAFLGSTDGSMVRHGETEAEVLVELEDGLKVDRRLKASGSQTVSVSRGEMDSKKPQAMLNGLLGDTTFNPLDLLDAKARTDHILKCIDLKVTEADLAEAAGECPVPLPPLDYKQHGLKVAEQAHKYFYQRRAEANKVAADKVNTFMVKQKEIPAAPEDLSPDTSTEELRASIEDCRVIIEVENKKKANVEFAERSYQEKVTHLNRGLAARKAAETELVDLEKTIAVKKAHLEKINEGIVRVELEVKEADAKRKSEGPNAEFIQNQNELIQTAQNILTRRAEIKAHQERVFGVKVHENEAHSAKDFANRLHQVVERTGSPFRVALMSRAKLPIAGLTFSDDQFYLNGSTIDNLSGAESLRLSVAIARHLASKTKLICIDGAELLDAENYELLRNEIEGDGFTYFVTKVGEAFQHQGDKVITMDKGAVIQ